jgi:hypothetical protein
MSTANENTFRPYEDVAQQIVQRLETDEAYREEMKANPSEALAAAGIPDDVVGFILRAPVQSPELGLTASPCTDLTCWSSACPGTCSVTVVQSTTCYCGKAGGSERQ